MFKKIIIVLLVIFLPVSFAAASENKSSEKAKDHGGEPWIIDIEKLTKENEHFRVAHWTGKRLQMTVMSILPGSEIGLEVHPDEEQFIRVEEGEGRVVMGKTKDNLTFDKKVSDDWAIFIPAGYWHNVINTGKKPLKVYVLYSPPEHPAGTIHKTFEEAEADHHHHDDDHK
jgi:mannose-6-phosphate isomerase-like protein (cupin superfamily)